LRSLAESIPNAANLALKPIQKGRNSADKWDRKLKSSGNIKFLYSKSWQLIDGSNSVRTPFFGKKTIQNSATESPLSLENRKFV
jgi:hypothetical protein